MFDFKEWWGLAVAVASGVGATLNFIWNRRKSKRAEQRQSTSLLYEQLEDLKKKVILSVARDVAQTTELGEKQKIIEGLRNHCPECYESFMTTLINNDERQDQ